MVRSFLGMRNKEPFRRGLRDVSAYVTQFLPTLGAAKSARRMWQPEVRLDPV